jgi:hypothetical protein
LTLKGFVFWKGRRIDTCGRWTAPRKLDGMGGSQAARGERNLNSRGVRPLSFSETRRLL